MKPRIVFMHFPKTGGTSLHRYMVAAFAKERVCPERFNVFDRFSDEDLKRYDYFSAHMDYRNLRRCANPAFTMTVLREPKARILSLYYFWRAHTDANIEKNNLSGPRLAKRLSLLEFLNWNEDGIPGNFDNYYVRNLLGTNMTGPGGAMALADEDALRVAMRNLLSIDAVGFTDDLRPLFSIASRKLGREMPEKLPRALASSEFGKIPGTEEVVREEITPEIDRRLDELTRLDKPLYEAAKAIFVGPVQAEESRPSRLSLANWLTNLRSS